MDDETPKPMRKLPKNKILRKVGRKLEKFEKNLGLQTPTLTHDYGASLNDLSRTDSQYSEQQDDTISLQYIPNSDSPKAILRHRHSMIFISRKNYFKNTFFLDNRLDRSQSSTPSVDSDISLSWQSNTEECKKIFCI